MGSNHEVSGVISIKFILAAGFNQSTLWRGPAQSFDFDSVCTYLSLPHLKRLSLLFYIPYSCLRFFLDDSTDSYLENIGLPVSKQRGCHKE